MSTKKTKSHAMVSLEEIVGGQLTLGDLIHSIR